MVLIRERRHLGGGAGGIVSGPAVSVAATLALLGLPALRYLNTDDEEERLLLNAVALRAAELHDQMQHNLATHIVNAIAKAMR